MTGSGIIAQGDMGIDIAAALDWWREAGVDCDFTQAPQNWLAETPVTDPNQDIAISPALAEPDKPAPQIGGLPSTWPKDLAEFRAWWLDEPTLATARSRRVAPAGPHRARLMILVAMPEADDAEMLLAGKTGRLCDALLEAFGLTREQIYLASALPAHVALPDWEALAGQGLGAVMAHHIALAEPQRILVLGRGGISTLLGNGSAQSAAHLSVFNHGSVSSPMMIAADLEALMASPGMKAGLWNRWLDWTGAPQV